MTEALGGGSHTAVIPAAAISAARPARTAYQGGSGRCAHSQLKPCAPSRNVLVTQPHSRGLQSGNYNTKTMNTTKCLKESVTLTECLL